MKNLLYLFLLCATPLCAQSEFGLSFKAGNFTLPKKGSTLPPLRNCHSSNVLSAGFSGSIGVFENLHLNQRWSLNACLLYSLAAFSLKQDFIYEPEQDDQLILYKTSWTRNFYEHKLLLPIQAQFHLKSSGKTALGFGVCPSFNLFTYQKATSAEPESMSLTVQQLQTIAYFRQGTLAAPTRRVQLLWMASLQQAIGKNTCIGIELLVAPRRNNLNIYFNDYEDKMLPSRSPFSMKSLQVSLFQIINRH